MKKINKLINFPILMIVAILRLFFAYIGPGAGLSALGALLAVIGGIAATLFGLLWYPIKRFFGKNKKTQEPDPVEDDEE